MDKDNVVRVNFRPEPERPLLDAKSLWLRDILNAMPTASQPDIVGMMHEAMLTGDAVKVSFDGYELICDRVQLIATRDEKKIPTPSKEPGQ